MFDGFTSCLGPWIPNHLHNIEELTLNASEATPLGNTGHRYGSDISLEHANMPRLRILTLRNIRVYIELSDFLVRRLATLESITMQECYGLDWWHRPSPDHIFWNELFTVLADACTPAPESPFDSPSRPPARDYRCWRRLMDVLRVNENGEV
jgi:hypothetical protein